ncbi:MAG: hypothetical protein ACREER_06300 [Alphaproteobacteria bacterium]
MALKDLVAEKGTLDEAAIERIVSPYVRYDVKAKEITFMQAFAGLSNKAKILVYLAALQGWKFVTDDSISSDARPADIEAATGIRGGSLRPTLRGLCEGHVLSERDSRYSVRPASFPAIEAGLKGSDQDVVIRRARPSPRKASRTARDTTDDAGNVEDVQIDNGTATESAGAKRVRKLGRKTRNIAATFERWIDEGYFDEPRTLADVQRRFRKNAIMVPQTRV